MSKRTNRQWANDPKVIDARREAIAYLREIGFSFKEIAVAIGRTPEQVRAANAKWVRLLLKKKEAK